MRDILGQRRAAREQAGRRGEGGGGGGGGWGEGEEGELLVHMNCEGCEYGVIEALAAAGT